MPQHTHALEMLKADHAQVMALIRRFGFEDDPERRRTLCGEIAQAVS